MRHLGTLLAALVITPVAWVLTAAGQPRAQQTFDRWADADTVSTADLLAPLAMLIGAGVLIGLIGTIQWSPVGPLVAGLLLLCGYAIALVSPFVVQDALPVWLLNGARVDLAAPLTNGTLAVLGSALVMAVASRKRWRGGAPPAPTRPVAVPQAPDAEPRPPAEAFASTTTDTAEDLPRPGRYRVTPAHYIPPPRRGPALGGAPTGTEPPGVDEDNEPPFSSPWAGPPRPPEG